MVIHYTKHFIKSFKAIPKKIQQMALDQESIFKLNPNDVRLHSKPLQGRLKGLYSFRITRNYRILFTWQTVKDVVFHEIGDRKWIYK